MKPVLLPVPNISRMGYKPANFAFNLGTGQGTSRRIWRRFEGQAERLIHELTDNVTTKYEDNVL